MPGASHVFAEGMFSFVFLVDGWIISILILVCHRYSEWREGSGNHSARAFWTRLWCHECELRQSCFATVLCVSVSFKVLSPVPPPLPTHKVQTLAVSWTSVTWLPGTDSILPRLHYAVLGASRKMLYLKKNSLMSNFKLSDDYLGASHRDMCDMDNSRRHIIHWVVVPTNQTWVLSLFSAWLCIEGGGWAK